MERQNLDCAIDKIYREIDDRFGGENPLQIFTLLFPTQPLNYRDFVYDVTSHTSVLGKPQVVAEAEFRLADQLVDPAPVVGASNGKQLSVVYEQLLDNYVPDMNRLAPYLLERAQFHEFLEKPIRVGDTTTTRVDLFHQYFGEYTQQKSGWATQINDKKREAKAPDDDYDWDDFATWIATLSPAEHAKIDASYSMIVTKGYLHETFAILGYLNSASPAESLERAKQSLRHAARGAIDETGSVYPVQFQPSNWFQAMKPNLNPEDLTMAADAIISSLRSRREQLVTAKAHLGTLLAIHVTDEQREALEASYRAAKADMDESERKLVQAHGQGTINMVKSIARHRKEPFKDDPKSVAEVDSLLASVGHKARAKEEGVLTAINDTIEVQNAQRENIRAIESYEEASRMWQRSQTADFKLQLKHAEDRIQNLEAEILELEELVVNINGSRQSATINTEGWESMLRDGGAQDVVEAFKNLLRAAYEAADDDVRYIAFKREYPNGALDMPGSFAEVDAWASESLRLAGMALIRDKLAPKGAKLSGDLPRSNLSDEMESMFTTITIVVNADESRSTTSDSSASASSSWGVSSWFSSYRSSSTSSVSDSRATTAMASSKTVIAMRVMKVSFQRSWFQPSLLEKTADFHNVSETIRAGMGLNKVHVRSATSDGGKAPFVEKLKLASKPQGEPDRSAKTYILPAYPVAMLIAKDITIKMSSSESLESSWNSASKSSSASSGGFLMFGGSSSNSSARSSSSAFSSASGKDVVIRIPGPQILGYINQLVPDDKSRDYEAGAAKNGGVTLDEVLTRYDKIFDELHGSASQDSAQ